MATVVVFERVDLVDHDGSDVPQVLTHSERVVDALVGPDHDVGVRVEALAVPADAARADPDGDVREVAVVVLEVLVLLVRERDERHQEEHLALALK